MRPTALALCVLSVCLAAGARALDVSPCDAPPTLDGRLDDPCWQGAASLDLAWEIDPGDRAPAPVATTCLITHDRGALYVAFRAFDPEPDRIRANLAERDAAFGDDWVGIVIDPFADRRRAFQFLVSAGGVQMDLTWSETAAEPDDPAWDADWDTAARVDSLGYMVEIAVPFRSLRYRAADGERTWGAIAYRYRPRSVTRMFCSAPLDPDEACELCQADDLVGFADIGAGRDLELAPTYTVSRTDLREDFPDGPLVGGEPAWDLGLTAHWGPAPDVSLDAALNPDFSQVEADELQLDVNTRWALFYDEKRPVFLEGADLFETHLDAVHTRMLVSPEWVAKMSAKRGADAVSAFAARDQWTNLMDYRDGGSRMKTVEREHTAGAARWRRDVGEGSTVGALVTGREGGGYRNLLGGVDAVLRPGGAHELEIQALASTTTLDVAAADTLGLAPGDLRDGGVTLIYTRDGRDWSWLVGWERIGADLRADLGFIDRVDTERRDLGLWRSWWRPQSRGIHFVGLGVHGTEIRDTEGELSDRELRTELNVMGPLQSRLWLATDLLRERFAGTIYDQTIVRGKVGCRPHDAVWLWARAWSGDDIHYGEALPATAWGAGPGLTWTPTPRLELDAGLIRYDLAVDGDRVQRQDQAHLRLQFALGLRTHLRWTTQYEIETTNERVRTVFSQFLFTFRASPETVVFLGTTDRRFALGEAPVALHDRTFFLKVGYAWRP